MDHFAILLRLRREVPYIWITTEQHVVVNIHVVRNERRLRNVCNVLCTPARRCRRNFSLIDGDRPCVWNEPCSCTQHRRLASAVRTNETQPFTRMQQVVKALHCFNTVVRHTHITKTERGHFEVFLVRRRNKKNGAPKNAVTTPIGVSAGLASTRLGISANTRNAAPSNTLSGSTFR